MKDYSVVKYSVEHFDIWNTFVSEAKNATFLFHRDFMEYHQDRFEDYSLMIFKKDKLIAVLPANRSGQDIHSHQGLTYGGLLLSEAIKFDSVLEIFRKVLKFLKSNGFENMILKQVPFIYNSVFTEETKYLLFILKAELQRRDTLSVLDLSNKIKVSNNRLEGYKRAIKHNLVIKEEEDFELFWNNILVKNLKSKHNAKPVHNLEEITLLKKRFHKNIRQFNVYKNDKIVAGTTIFESEFVAHSQYISGDENKNTLGSLDLLHLHLIHKVFNNKRFFDFGTSNENNGLQVNKGLQFWKEGFGARTVIQDFYIVKINNFDLLNNVFV